MIALVVFVLLVAVPRAHADTAMTCHADDNVCIEEAEGLGCEQMMGAQTIDMVLFKCGDD